MRKEYKEKHDKVLGEALSTDKVEPFHKIKEGNIVKFPFTKSGVRYSQFKQLLPKSN